MNFFNTEDCHIEIDSAVEGLEAADKAGTISGWAVDLSGRQALDFAVEAAGPTTPPASQAAQRPQASGLLVTRVLRTDLIAMFDLDKRAKAGFVIELPAGVEALTFTINLQGRHVTKTVTVEEIAGSLKKEARTKRFKRISRTILRAWTPEGFAVLTSVLKRRRTPEQDSYQDWIRQHEVMSQAVAEGQMRAFDRNPLISIVVPVYNVEEEWLRKCVDSMQRQWYTNWELCLADDHSPSGHVRPLLEELAASDERIKLAFRQENGGISAATNSALDLATGEYIGFMDNDDELAPQALFFVVQALNQDPTIDFIYTDEDKMTEDGTRFDPFFKPGFSPDLLLSHNYITHFVVVSKGLLDHVGPLRSEFDGSQDYDFVLRATESAQRIHHIGRILYHWRTLASSVAGDPYSKMYAYEAGGKVLEEALKRRGLTGSVRMLDNLGTYRIDYEGEAPSVAVLASSYGKAALRALKENTKYSKVTIVPVGDAKPNQLAQERSEDLLVFLDGLVPRDPLWLQEMVNASRGEGIGLVGGKIMDSRQRVLNVGMTLRALKGRQPFEMRGQLDHGIGYYFRDLLPHDMFAVTEDCMLVGREDFVSLGGFNEELAPGIQGIDFSQRMYRQAGLRALWEPYSVFVDSKPKHMGILRPLIFQYLRQHKGLEDPFGTVCFPPDMDEEVCIESSIDSIEVAPDGLSILVSGWAVDQMAGEQVTLGMEEVPWATLRQVKQLSRPDVNSLYPVPADAKLGFEAKVAVVGDQADLHQVKPVLTVSTSQDREELVFPERQSRFKTVLGSLLRKLALLRHPRTMVKRLIDKYVSPHLQKYDYKKLIRSQERYQPNVVEEEIKAFSHRPLISLLVPVYNVDATWLKACVDSIRNQYYDNWQLCLADDCSTQPHVKPLLEEMAASDCRIKVVFRQENGHISRATNSALEIAEGEFVGLLDNDDELAPQALYEMVKCLNQHPETDMIYSDEDKIDEKGHRFDPHFKPDYAPDLLLSTNYISHFGLYRTSIVRQIGGFRPGFEGSQDYDLVLRFTERTQPSRIRHIAKVLYHWRTLPTSTASSGGAKSYASDAGLKALQSAMDRRGIKAEVLAEGPAGIYDVHYQIDDPALVSVIIPTKNGYDNIKRCVDSLIERTDYPNYEIIVADNGSTNPHMWDLYRQYQEELGERFRAEKIDMPFNFSTINNRAAQHAKGKYLLFLNDDTEVISDCWMTRMVSFAQLKRVGVVGAKLYYLIETIQHAGIVLGLGGPAGHILVGSPRTYLGYFGRLVENVNYSAVTAACCMVKAEDFAAVGGFDEDLAVAYNDVDLCLRISQRLGRDIVWAHEVELYHYESVTRGYDVKSKAKMERLKAEGKKFMARYADIIDDDPYYNPNLSRTSGNFWVRKV
ncbi:glycosyl transferase [Bifidobacterium aemilianum]|uniref:Glycosyl transferase n=1 Tax=Bifidobacterium aemilianum TaxID=2493120 RepID=A0A366K9R4_9BIFI|nr:glycosyltransferase [Bifidobacterium aemilianum]RBP97908.1 glycosyl transferase [Bifidobacterium aemilianum]